MARLCHAELPCHCPNSGTAEPAPGRAGLLSEAVGREEDALLPRARAGAPESAEGIRRGGEAARRSLARTGSDRALSLRYASLRPDDRRFEGSRLGRRSIRLG